MKDNKKEYYKQAGKQAEFTTSSACESGTCKLVSHEVVPVAGKITLSGDSLTARGFSQSDLNLLKNLISSIYNLLYKDKRPEWKVKVFKGDVRIAEVVHHPSCAHVLVFDVNGSALPEE